MIYIPVMSSKDIERAASPTPVKCPPVANEKDISVTSLNAPDGGLRAWLAAAGGSCIFFSALGFANAFGVFEEYYLSHQLIGKSPDDVAWIGSLAACLQFAAGALGGPLFDRFGAWVSSYFDGEVTWRANIAIGHSACRCSVHFRNHDDQPMQGVLAVDTCTGGPNGLCDGPDSVPSDGSRDSVL